METTEAYPVVLDSGVPPIATVQRYMDIQLASN